MKFKSDSTTVWLQLISNTCCKHVCDIQNSLLYTEDPTQSSIKVTWIYVNTLSWPCYVKSH